MANVLKTESVEEKTHAARDVTGLAGFNLNDLADEGRSRLEECRRRIHEMLEDARREAEQLRQEAEQKGYEEGRQRAAKEAEEQLRVQSEERARDGLKLLSQAVQQMHRSHEQWMQQYAQSLHQTALAAARRIVQHRLDQEPELLVQWAAEALMFTRSSTEVVLALHPETLAKLGPAFDHILHSSELPERTTIEPDETVAIDAVVVRQDGGEIETGLSSQLQRLEELLA